MGTDAETIRAQVRQAYAEAAQTDAPGGCGSGSCCSPAATDGFGRAHYGSEEAAGELPEEVLHASLGCGNPATLAELREGETVLDLGSGGGIDVILSARRVGPMGTVYGLDMTDEMLALGRRNADDAGVRNVHFLKGLIEAIPLAPGSIDAVISNCVVNLSPEKQAVLREIARVLRPGGRLAISDVVAEDRLGSKARSERGTHVGCLAGASSIGEYEAGLAAAGLEEIQVELTGEVADGMHSAIVRARKPASADPPPLPALAAAGRGCC
jgi:arsenite methyltransferase